jgi:hypothetical protein
LRKMRRNCAELRGFFTHAHGTYVTYVRCDVRFCVAMPGRCDVLPGRCCDISHTTLNMFNGMSYSLAPQHFIHLHMSYSLAPQHF